MPGWMIMGVKVGTVEDVAVEFCEVEAIVSGRGAWL